MNPVESIAAVVAVTFKSCRNLRNDGIDGTHEKRRREDDERHEIENASHGDRLRASALGQPIELDQLAQERLHLLYRKHIGTVRRRLVGILVRLDK